MSTFKIGITEAPVDEFPLTYDDVVDNPGAYEVSGRPEVLLVTSDENNAGSVTLRFSNGEDNRFYPASGWEFGKFRKVSRQITITV